MDFFLKENNNFIPFSHQHLWVVIFFITFGCMLILFTKKQKEKIQHNIGNMLAFSISLTVIFGTFLKLYKGDFNYQEDLPLHLCSFMAIIIPILSSTRKFLYYEIFFFLILAGTLQSLITPDENNYLNFPFFRYWFVHAGLVIFMMFATFIYKMRPTLKSVGKSFLGMQVYMIFTFILNYFLGSNYFYTNRKPNAATLLDLFGDWPQYIFVVQLIVIPYFLLIYLPFYLTRKPV
ncbi:TIGR02206 family membrane protein [uncultured Polaribacter sp.]|uniref:YwaF family protein n=1 Tax=uncultured Polaribacter sp. TaxID=174711 RepID=UPI00261D16B1|nr:TIGR02206 family membrane protein [uncultured Polaribacter sp.]